MRKIFFIYFAFVFILSCSDRRLYEQDGQIYYGKIDDLAVSAIFKNENVDLFLSRGNDSAYYFFKIHPLFIAPQYDVWSGQLVYLGHISTDDFNQPLKRFPNDPEYGGLTFQFIDDNLFVGENQLNIAQPDRRNRILNLWGDYMRLLNDPYWAVFFNSADEWEH